MGISIRCGGVVIGFVLLAFLWWTFSQDAGVGNGESDYVQTQERNEPSAQAEREQGTADLLALDEGDSDLARETIPAIIDVSEPIETHSGSLSGQLVLASKGAVDRFVWAVRLEGPGQSWPMNSVRLNKDGTFHAENLDPGWYDVSVEREGLALAIVEQILVVAQSETKDPRINPWNAEESCREMRLQISGSPGIRGDTNVWAVSGESKILGHARRVDGEWVLQCTEGQAPDVIVIAPSYQPERIPWQDGDVAVTLEPGFKAELQAVLPVEMDPQIKRGWFSLEPEFPLFGLAPSQFSVHFSAREFISGKAVAVTLPATGAYVLRFDGDIQDGPGFIPMYRTIIQRGIHLSESSDEISRIPVVLPNPLKNNPK